MPLRLERFSTWTARRGEVYVILWTEPDRVEACRCVGRWAADPRLSFDWLDAAVMNCEIRAAKFGE